MAERRLAHVIRFTAALGHHRIRGACQHDAPIQILLAELPRFLPQFSAANLIGSTQWIVIGVLTLTFMWFRPRGLFPEKKRVFDVASRGVEARSARTLDGAGDETVGAA